MLLSHKTLVKIYIYSVWQFENFDNWIFFSPLLDLNLNDTTGNDSSLNKTTEEIINPEVMDNEFDTRSENSEHHDVISGVESELGKHCYHLSSTLNDFK